MFLQPGVICEKLPVQYLNVSFMASRTDQGMAGSISPSFPGWQYLAF